MTELDAFIGEAEGFLEAHAKKRSAFEWGVGPDGVSILDAASRDHEVEEVRRAREWQALKFDNGLGWIDGPTEHGGRGLPATYAESYVVLESSYDVPDGHVFGIGHGMAIPMLLAHGTPELAAGFVRPIRHGALICCQLFSEPGAGSDLASVTTRATRDRDDWIVSGQKVWSSGAQYSDLGLLLARTDTAAPKHRGLTMFLIDMTAPGVDVQPLRQMTGGAHFNEVFLDEVRVPDARRLGDAGAGWPVAVGTLMNERASVGSGGANAAWADIPFGRLVATAQHVGTSSDPHVRQQLARLYTERLIADVTTTRLTGHGRPPGAEMSILKLASSLNLVRTSEAAAAILQQRVIADTGEWGTFAWAKFVLAAPGMRIGGGTDDVQRNILGERILGLPKEAG